MLSILVITVSLLAPIAAELGFDNIWLGILMVKLIEIGMVIAPGASVASWSRVPRGVKVAEVLKGIWPFVVIDLVIVAVLFLMPDIILWLPSLVVNY